MRLAAKVAYAAVELCLRAKAPVVSTGRPAPRQAVRGAVRRALSAPPAFVCMACLAVVVVRLTYVTQPLRFDEAGYLMVAQQWHDGGPYLYGDYWLDRPPGLMLIFHVASLFDSDSAVRAIAIPFAVVFVVAAARTARLLGGVPSARLATLIAAALVATPATGADQSDGEIFAASVVMAAIALLIEAHHHRTTRPRFGLALGAGILAATAPLVKQNFIDALVFGAVMLAVGAWRRSDHRQATIVTGALLGAALPLVAVCVWTYAAWFDLATLAYALVGFRIEAMGAIAEQGSRATVYRGLFLVLLAIFSGIVPILLRMVRAGWRGRRSGSPVGWATATIAAIGVLSISAGGTYSPHYLLQLAPCTVLGTALMARARGSHRGLRRVCVAAACSAMVASTAMAVFYVASPLGWWPQRTGAWLRVSSAPRDTAVVLYGAASIQHSSGLRSPYPYLWSLPVRVNDPNLERLEATLRGPEAPSWIVQASGFNAWNLDANKDLRTQVQASYRVVAEVCGTTMWLRRDLSRELADPPDCSPTSTVTYGV